MRKVVIAVIFAILLGVLALEVITFINILNAKQQLNSIDAIKSMY